MIRREEKDRPAMVKAGIVDIEGSRDGVAEGSSSSGCNGSSSRFPVQIVKIQCVAFAGQAFKTDATVEDGGGGIHAVGFEVDAAQTLCACKGEDRSEEHTSEL